MSKILITEKQLQTIKSQINEGVSDQYSRDVLVDFWPRKALFNGKEINDIAKSHIKVMYNIEIEAREWGIKDVSLYNITGPTEIDVQIEYFIDNDNTEFENIKLKLDWDLLQTDVREGSGVVTVGDDLNIDLINDENGNLVVDTMSMDVYSL